MHSPLRSNVVPPERHDLIFLDPGSWVAIFNDYPDLRSQPLTSDWSRRGLPLVARRHAMCNLSLVTDYPHRQ